MNKNCIKRTLLPLFVITLCLFAKNSSPITSSGIYEPTVSLIMPLEDLEDFSNATDN